MDSLKRPVLSICIPAYRYAEGVARIIKSIGADARVEIIISDDDKGHPVDLGELVSWPNVHYTINPKPSGAIANWNRLVTMATGAYVWIIHHDEIPVFERDVGELISKLLNHDAADIYISKIVLDRYPALHFLWNDYVRIVAIKFPIILLFLNVIGSPSNIIFRKDRFLPFDQSLTWLVDVEWYSRQLKNSRKNSLSAFRVRSVSYDGSITQNIKSDICKIEISEINYISEKHGLSKLLRLSWQLKCRLFHYAKGFIRCTW